MYGHILIPTDGSEVSQRGVDHGLALAKALGARVTILTVTEPLPSYSGVGGGGFGLTPDVIRSYDDQQNKQAETILANSRAEAERLGVSVTVLHVPNGFAADSIVEAAKVQGAELIVMASHGRRGLGRLLIGSQASAVVNHSPIPVLVVR